MDPDRERRLEKKIEETNKLAKDNHKMLRAIRRSMVWGSVMRVVYWLIIVGAAFFGYYILQPLVDDVSDAWGTVRESINDVKEAGDKVKDIGSSVFGE